MERLPHEPLGFFSDYMGMTGVPRLDPDPDAEEPLRGKSVGLLNGSSWVQGWAWYFARLFLPGVRIVSVGNDAVQLNFMAAHRAGSACPPPSNIEIFCQYARHLVDLAGVDAILVTCSTMNRSADSVRQAVPGTPVVQIDEPMMETAVSAGGTVLVIATHGPTVASTQSLLHETAERLGRSGGIEYRGVTVERAFELLGRGDIRGHNAVIQEALYQARRREKIDRVVLAQLSMSAFLVEHPDPESEFGLPVLASGTEGFRRMREILKDLESRRTGGPS